MSIDTPTRAKLLHAMANHVLAHGLNDASLRPLAAAAETSDRMLIYHFGCKEDLISALLTHLGSLFIEALEDSLPPGRFASEYEGVLEILSLMRAPRAQGFQRVWFDILSASLRGSAAHRTTAQTILGSLHNWLVARMPASLPSSRTADLLLRIEGILIAEAIGRNDLVSAALEWIKCDGQLNKAELGSEVL